LAIGGGGAIALFLLGEHEPPRGTNRGDGDGLGEELVR